MSNKGVESRRDTRIMSQIAPPQENVCAPVLVPYFLPCRRPAAAAAAHGTVPSNGNGILHFSMIRHIMAQMTRDCTVFPRARTRRCARSGSNPPPRRRFLWYYLVTFITFMQPGGCAAAGRQPVQWRRAAGPRQTDQRPELRSPETPDMQQLAQNAHICRGSRGGG